MAETAREPLLTVRYENRNPVDLLDLGNSLTAIAERYRRLNNLKGRRRGGRLYVRQMRPGSIIAELMPLLEQVSSGGDYREVLAAFVTNLDDLFRGFMLYDARLLRRTSRTDARQVQRILAPTAKDGGSQTFININVEGDLHISGPIQISSDQANEIGRGARRFLREGPLPEGLPIEGEVLYLTQARDERLSKSADRGVIEAIWDKPLQLNYESDRIRREILGRRENPFRLLFVVDGEVQVVGDKPVSYTISRVREWYDPEK